MRKVRCYHDSKRYTYLVYKTNRALIQKDDQVVVPSGDRQSIARVFTNPVKADLDPLADYEYKEVIGTITLHRRQLEVQSKDLEAAIRIAHKESLKQKIREEHAKLLKPTLPISTESE